MKIAYVSGPYSNLSEWEKAKNIERAMQIARDIWKIPGLCAICPHGNTAHMGGDITYEKFIEGDLEMVRRADCVVMSPDWKTSAGTGLEWAEAIREGKPIFYWPLDRPALMRWASRPSWQELWPRTSEDLQTQEVGPVS